MRSTAGIAEFFRGRAGFPVAFSFDMLVNFSAFAGVEGFLCVF
jgi:hypothetical protein